MDDVEYPRREGHPSGSVSAVRDRPELAMSGRTADRNRSTRMTGPWGRADTAPSAGVGAAFFEAVVEALAEAASGKHSRNDRCRPRELAQPTPSRRWHFSGRAAGPLRKRSFASQAAKSPPGDSGRSRVASTARYKHAVERLHLKAANRRCRPKSVVGSGSRVYAIRPSICEGIDSCRNAAAVRHKSGSCVECCGSRGREFCGASSPGSRLS